MQRSFEVIDHGGALPDLGIQHINMYGAKEGKGDVVDHMAQLLRKGFEPMQQGRTPAPLRRVTAVGC